MSLFDKEFYPTPGHVLDRMGIDCRGKKCLEPSAGKGDIIDYLKELGAKEVIACEKNDDLRMVSSSKVRMIAKDFFEVTAEQVSHINLIVMNPPFSNADKHILHAWKIAPEGCEIIALCNWETINNRYSYSRGELSQLIRDYGNEENLGDCFSTADRRTGVEVGLIHLFKPALSSGFDFDGFYFTDEETSTGEGVIPYNEIRAIVNSYVAAVKCYDRFRDIEEEMNRYTGVTNFGNGFSLNLSYGETGVVTKSDFSKEMQKHCWKFVFDKMGIQKYVTKGVMEDINLFVEQQQTYPFTMRNIYRMIEILTGTRSNTMNRAVVEAVDNFTRYTHENRFGVEGWKTNSGYMLNKKFICKYIAETSYSGDGTLRFSYRGETGEIVDLQKALCFLTAKDFDSIQREYDFKNLKSNKWYDWGFFEFKVFKKGSGHFKFKDEKVWELLNRKYAEIKGQALPEKL